MAKKNQSVIKNISEVSDAVSKLTGLNYNFRIKTKGRAVYSKGQVAIFRAMFKKVRELRKNPDARICDLLAIMDQFTDKSAGWNKGWEKWECYDPRTKNTEETTYNICTLQHDGWPIRPTEGSSEIIAAIKDGILNSEVEYDFYDEMLTDLPNGANLGHILVAFSQKLLQYAPELACEGGTEEAAKLLSAYSQRIDKAAKN